FRVGDAVWKCDLNSYECTGVGPAPRRPEPLPEPPAADDLFPSPDAGEQFVAVQPPPERPRESRSPDRKWTAFVKDSNVVVRTGDEEIKLSETGVAGNAFEIFGWSPDSKTLVAAR